MRKTERVHPLDAQGAAPLAALLRDVFPEPQHVGAAVVLQPDRANRVASAVAVALLAEHDAVGRSAAGAFLDGPALAVTAGERPLGGLRVTVAGRRKEPAWG